MGKKIQRMNFSELFETVKVQQSKAVRSFLYRYHF